MAAASGARKRRVQLRLDDGSIIGSQQSLLGTEGPAIVLLDYEQAARTGRAGEADLARLDKLISAFQSRIAGFHSIPRNELRSRNPYDVQRVIKRQRSLANGELPGLASPERGGATAPHALAHTPGSGVAAAPTDFLPRCMGVLHGLYDAASQMAPLFNLQVKDVFYKPVSATFPNIAADYYSRISHPMTWQMVEQRITGGVYASAQDFADDMRLVVANCKQYNPLPADPVRVACLKLGEVFEDLWARSGLCAEVARARRATAGIAAPKFEPEDFDHGGGPKRSGEPRRQSHEVSSFQEEEVEQHAIPEEWIAEVAELLQSLEPDNLQVALEKFNEGVVSYDEEGEVELDLSKVDYPSLSDVDAYIRQVKGMPPRELPARRNAPAATEPSDGDGMRSRGVVRAEQEDDDEYYGEEDDSDDDD